ncbi:hypothetical protein MIR68_002514 [Amoeboaphelidium protococcarum]|nr:hypothetical protein MIR68_002514 [Amoeboaphelidium protococcarum]
MRRMQEHQLPPPPNKFTLCEYGSQLHHVQSKQQYQYFAERVSLIQDVQVPSTVGLSQSTMIKPLISSKPLYNKFIDSIHELMASYPVLSLCQNIVDQVMSLLESNPVQEDCPLVQIEPHPTKALIALAVNGCVFAFNLQSHKWLTITINPPQQVHCLKSIRWNSGGERLAVVYSDKVCFYRVNDKVEKVGAEQCDLKIGGASVVDYCWNLIDSQVLIGYQNGQLLKVDYNVIDSDSRLSLESILNERQVGLVDNNRSLGALKCMVPSPTQEYLAAVYSLFSKFKLKMFNYLMQSSSLTFQKEPKNIVWLSENKLIFNLDGTCDITLVTRDGLKMHMEIVAQLPLQTYQVADYGQIQCCGQIDKIAVCTEPVQKIVASFKVQKQIESGVIDCTRYLAVLNYRGGYADIVSLQGFINLPMQRQNYTYESASSPRALTMSFVQSTQGKQLCILWDDLTMSFFPFVFQ